MKSNKCDFSSREIIRSVKELIAESFLKDNIMAGNILLYTHYTFIFKLLDFIIISVFGTNAHMLALIINIYFFSWKI